MGGSQRHVQDKSYFVGILRAKMAELTTEIKNIQVRKPLLLLFFLSYSPLISHPSRDFVAQFYCHGHKEPFLNM